MDSSEIYRYFPETDSTQKKQIDALYDLYSEWNSKINVISRKDIDELYIRHVLHSLAIQKFCTFTPGQKVLDVGTGGGFPGIPLAIMNPETQFHLVDSIGKKITVVKAIASALGLRNVSAEHIRAEQVKDKFDTVVTRAVAQTNKLIDWTWKKLRKNPSSEIFNGLVALKGGDLSEELSPIKKKYEVVEIPTYFKEDFFETKKIVAVKY